MRGIETAPVVEAVCICGQEESLDTGEPHRSRYLANHPGLQGALLFVDALPEEDFAALAAKERMYGVLFDFSTWLTASVPKPLRWAKKVE